MSHLKKDEPIHSIDTVACLFGITKRCLNLYDTIGLVRPKKVGNEKKYSPEDVCKIEYIHYLSAVRKVEIKGLSVIMELLDCMNDKDRAFVFERCHADMNDDNLKTRDVADKASKRIIREILDNSIEYHINNSKQEDRI
ncbi:MAG: MerR family transcriptional regulator [Armatimonadota bacterium]